MQVLVDRAPVAAAAVGLAVAPVGWLPELRIKPVQVEEVQERVTLVARYTLGTAAILAGLSHTCRRLGRLDVAAAAWGIAAATGSVVAGAHMLRQSQPDSLEILLKDGDSNAVWLPSARRTR